MTYQNLNKKSFLEMAKSVLKNYLGQKSKIKVLKYKFNNSRFSANLKVDNRSGFFRVSYWNSIDNYNGMYLIQEFSNNKELLSNHEVSSYISTLEDIMEVM